MSQAATLAQQLSEDFVRRYPHEAADALAQLPIAAVVDVLDAQAITAALSLWEGLPHDIAADVLPRLDGDQARQLLERADAVHNARVLLRLRAELRAILLAPATAAKARELEQLMAYAEDSAGALMDPNFLVLHGNTPIHDVLARLRQQKTHFSRQVFVTDSDGVLESMVDLRDLVIAEPEQLLGEIARPVSTAVMATASRAELIHQFDRLHSADLPVVDVNGRLVGAVRHDAIVEAVREESSADLLTMVGVSKDEHALSRIGFVVRKRLPWLQINLLTAFLAAAVVGIFESTIAQFTALAVLLPVVAGQSGNTGAQALAVTMRGLALREIGTSHWRRVVRKEVGAGFINGVAVALTTAAGVYAWSGSLGLALVLIISMVLSMVAAAFSGVIIPIVLSALGQDPAQSSSIVLTTVTDVTGFFTFLGTATLLASLL